MQGLLLVGAGGALGAMGRYGISQLPWKGAFPLWTLCVNFLGAVAIGLLSGLFAGKLLGERGKLFWQTGVCGGFNTFSTFSSSAWLSAWQGCCWASAWPGRWPIRKSIEKQPGPARNQLWLFLVWFMGEAPTPTG